MDVFRINGNAGQGSAQELNSLRDMKNCLMVEASKAKDNGWRKSMAGEIEARLKALDLVLPEAKPAIGSYVPFLHLNGQLFVSGQLPLKEGKLAAEGKVGVNLDLAQGQAAARVCAINILAQAKAALGDLDRIVQLLRLNGFVNAAPNFADHSKVLNAASDLMVEILGNKGMHTRIAIGCPSLPLNAAVEIDAIFAVD
jgi:enamine deaminase RidA (YjgF/YER057c/UK114 family)